MPEVPAGRLLTEPHKSRLPLSHPGRAEILAAHADALGRGEETYTDPSTGLVVFTSAFLLRRGWCCDSGCRHCPYVD